MGIFTEHGRGQGLARRGLVLALIGALLLATGGAVVSGGELDRVGDSAGNTGHSTGAPSRTTPPIPDPSPANDGTSRLRGSLNGTDCLFPDTPGARQIANRIMAADPLSQLSGSGQVAFAVHDDLTGVNCSHNGEQHFVAASVIKVATVAARLWQSETRGFELPEEERFWAELAITVSDNDAQEYLWQVVGGASAMAGFFAAAGMDHTVPSFADDDWGLTAITADDQLILVRQLFDATLLTRQDSDYLLGLMQQVSAEQVWGIEAGAPAGAVIALKNGWLDDTFDPIDDEAIWTINSIGHIAAPGASYALVVLSTGHTSDEAGREVVNSVARAVAAALLGQ